MPLNGLPPEWQIWLVQGIERGCKPADLLRNLTTRGHFSAQRALAAISDACRPGRLAALDVPTQPWIDPGQRCIELRGQQVSLRATFERPCAAVLDNLLSTDECAVLRGLGSKTQGNPLLLALEQRLSDLAHWPLSHFQPLRISHCRQGEEFAADLGLSSGQAAGRFVVYLEDTGAAETIAVPQAGGFRTFPLAGTALWLQQAPEEVPADGGAAQPPQPGGPRWVVTAGLRAQACRATTATTAAA